MVKQISGHASSELRCERTTAALRGRINGLRAYITEHKQEAVSFNKGQPFVRRKMVSLNIPKYGTKGESWLKRQKRSGKKKHWRAKFLFLLLVLLSGWILSAGSISNGGRAGQE